MQMISRESLFIDYSIYFWKAKYSYKLQLVLSALHIGFSSLKMKKQAHRVGIMWWVYDLHSLISCCCCDAAHSPAGISKVKLHSAFVINISFSTALQNNYHRGCSRPQMELHPCGRSDSWQDRPQLFSSSSRHVSLGEKLNMRYKQISSRSAVDTGVMKEYQAQSFTTYTCV